MYWVHRFGRGRRSKEFNDSLDILAMCSLLTDRNCMTVGWLSFTSTTENYNPNIVNAVEVGNDNQVKNLMLNAGRNLNPPIQINAGWARSLVNFTKMKSGDIVVVLPNKEIFPYFFIVEIISANAKSILNSPQNMTANFNINGVDFSFSLNSGWSRLSERFDVGFFHEVKILADKLPRNLIGNRFNYVRSTNSPVYDVSRIQYIDSLIPKS